MADSSTSFEPINAFLVDRPRFEWGEQEIVVDSRKPLALLCYLALRSDEVAREHLAELLWGPERLLNVRQALYQLRQLPGAESWLLVGEEVRVNAVSDVGRFERALEAGSYGEALEAWRPPLMAGLETLPALEFRTWLEVERSRLEGLYLRALEKRAVELEREGNFSVALELMKRFLESDPLRESAYRSVMRLSYIQGDGDGAMDAYRRCLKVMRSEFDSEPLPATIELAEAITAGRPLSLAVSPGHLPDTLLRILQAHVVGEGELDTRQLAAVLDLDEFQVAKGLGGLGQRRLLGAGGALRKDVIEETLTVLPDAVRSLLHGRIADVLMEGTGAESEEAIGLHLLRAQRREEAAPWLLVHLELAVKENDYRACLESGFRTLWCGNTEQRLAAALLLEEQAERAGDGDLQDALLAELSDLAWQVQQDATLARVGLRRARRLMRQRETAEAKKLAQEALATARRVGDRLLIAQAVNTMGALSFLEGRLEQAKRYFAENEGSEIEGERYRALNNLGAVAGLRGDFEASYSYLEQALTLVRRLGNVADIAACLNNLAATAERLADYPAAIARLREGRGLARRTGNRAYALQTLVNLAQVHLRRGSLGLAWNTAEEARSEAVELGDSRSEALALEYLGQIARLAGAAEESVDLLEDALERQGSDDERRLAGLRANLVLSRLATGAEADARAASDRIEAIEELGSTDVARWFWAELALLDEDAGRVLEWSQRAGSERDNRHLALIRAMAALRAALIDDAGFVPPSSRLAGELERVEVVEVPLGYTLLALTCDGEAGSDHAEYATKLLARQAQGLPGRLRESLLRQPRQWRAAVGFDA